jgi:Uma2 family endonuclease
MLTEEGELQMSPRPTPAHESKVKNLLKLLDHYLSCHPGGKIYVGPELRIHPYRRTLVPDLMYFGEPKVEWDQESTMYIDRIPDLAVEVVSPSNVGRKWEENLDFYRQVDFPEVWLVQLEGAVDVWRPAGPGVTAIYKPGELFSSPLFPRLAIDPNWVKRYPGEISRIERFNPKIVVSPSVVDQKLTERAVALAARIAEHTIT